MPFLRLYLAGIVPPLGYALPPPWDSRSLFPGVHCETSQWGTGSKQVSLVRFLTRLLQFGNEIAATIGTLTESKTVRDLKGRR